MTRSDDLLARAKRPAADALRLHPYYRGKIQTAAKAPIRSLTDFAIWCTPGVAVPCRAIQGRPELVYEHTNKAIIPTMDDEAVFVREAVAVAMKAQEQGVARLTRARDDLARTAEAVMREAKRATRALMEAGLIRAMPGEDA